MNNFEDRISGGPPPPGTSNHGDTGRYRATGVAHQQLLRISVLEIVNVLFRELGVRTSETVL